MFRMHFHTNPMNHSKIQLARLLAMQLGIVGKIFAILPDMVEVLMSAKQKWLQRSSDNNYKNKSDILASKWSTFYSPWS